MALSLGKIPSFVERDVPLAPFTTLELGGPAEYFVDGADEELIRGAVGWAAEQGLDVTLLGGGSNAIVLDEGVEGLVVHVRPQSRSFGTRGDASVVRVSAGEVFDDLVHECVARDLAGIECLSGIPGLAGGAPFQNVGAYGQEISRVVDHVRVLDRADLTVRAMSRSECAFRYRASAFRDQRDRYVILSMNLQLVRGGDATITYPELVRAVDERGNRDLSSVREIVIDLRRRKSMIVDPSDENRRSVGSFFTNPFVDDEGLARVRAALVKLDRDPGALPAWPDASGRTKLAAAFLVEAAGCAKGERRGPVGISSRHSLALVHHGGGTTRALLDLAESIRDRVRARFDIELALEPIVLGGA